MNVEAGGPAGPAPPAARAFASFVQALRERAMTPPREPREVLVDPAGRAFGSIDAKVAPRLAATRLLRRREGPSGAAWMPRVPAGADLDRSFEGIANWLRDAGLLGRWRDERLDVTTADDGEVIGSIERAAVRALGITTFAVHLIGRDPRGGTWVQQRALDKATDPGQWDTLVGGLRGSRESPLETLERETWEEAGLRLADLVGLRELGFVTVRRPVPEGYMVEHLDVFDAIVPIDVTPANRDGEVERFECLATEALRARLVDDRFTLEAALMLCGEIEPPRRHEPR